MIRQSTSVTRGVPRRWCRHAKRCLGHFTAVITFESLANRGISTQWTCWWTGQRMLVYLTRFWKPLTTGKHHFVSCLWNFCRISLDLKYNNYVAAEVTMSCTMLQNIFCPLPFAICSLPSRIWRRFWIPGLLLLERLIGTWIACSGSFGSQQFWCRKDATPLHLAIMASVKGAGGLEVWCLVSILKWV